MHVEDVIKRPLYLTEKGALTAPEMLGEVDAWRALWRTPGLAA